MGGTSGSCCCVSNNETNPAVRVSTGRRTMLLFIFGPIPFFLYLMLTMHSSVLVVDLDDLNKYMNLGGVGEYVQTQKKSKGVSNISWNLNDTPLFRTKAVMRRSLLKMPGSTNLVQNDFLAEIPDEDDPFEKKTEENRPAVKKKQFAPKIRKATNTNRHPNPNPIQNKNRRIPNVLLAGVQKSGTTAIASWIFHLNKVCKPESIPDHRAIKEVHFFNNEEAYRGGLEMYQQYFSHCGSDQSIWLDATPNYFPHAGRVAEIYNKANAKDDLKIIFILREPVDREFSWYNHCLADSHRAKTRKYARAVLDENQKLLNFGQYVKRSVLEGWNGQKTSFGQYAKWLEKWMEHFDRQQILVLSYDELLSDPASVVMRLRGFLELGDTEGPDEIAHHNKKANDKKQELPPCKAQAKLAEAYAEPNEKLYELLESKPGPESEQRPFGKFQLSACTENESVGTQ